MGVRCEREREREMERERVMTGGGGVWWVVRRLYLRRGGAGVCVFVRERE
jgi:hypothetical protein